MALEREDLEFFANIIREDIRRVEDGLNIRLDTLNGKTNANVTDIAVIKAQQNLTHTVARNHGATWGASLGGILTVVVTFLYHWLFGEPLPLK